MFGIKHNCLDCIDSFFLLLMILHLLFVLSLICMCSYLKWVHTVFVQSWTFRYSHNYFFYFSEFKIKHTKIKCPHILFKNASIKVFFLDPTAPSSPEHHPVWTLQMHIHDTWMHLQNDSLVVVPVEKATSLLWSLLQRISEEQCNYKKVDLFP